MGSTDTLISEAKPSHPMGLHLFKPQLTQGSVRITHETMSECQSVSLQAICDKHARGRYSPHLGASDCWHVLGLSQPGSLEAKWHRSLYILHCFTAT